MALTKNSQISWKGMGRGPPLAPPSGRNGDEVWREPPTGALKKPKMTTKDQATHQKIEKGPFRGHEVQRVLNSRGGGKKDGTPPTKFTNRREKTSFQKKRENRKIKRYRRLVMASKSGIKGDNSFILGLKIKGRKSVYLRGGVKTLQANTPA